MPADYFLAPVISYLGLLVGIILVKMSPEEQAPGKKYFILMKSILAFLIAMVFLFSMSLNVVFIGILAVLLASLLYWKKNALDGMVAYIVFGTIIGLSYTMAGFFLVQSVLVFLYGIPSASLGFSAKKKNYLRIFGKNALFFIPIILIYFL